MLFRHSKADVYIPEQTDPAQALARVTHLGIVSHQDDLEIAAYHGIAECFRREDQWFGGVVVSNGLFTTTLDFGLAPVGDCWLEIGVRTNGDGAFATLSPRQHLTPAPRAIRSPHPYP